MRDYEIVDAKGEVMLEVRAKNKDGARTAAFRYFHANILNKELSAWKDSGFKVREVDDGILPH